MPPSSFVTAASTCRTGALELPDRVTGKDMQAGSALPAAEQCAGQAGAGMDKNPSGCFKVDGTSRRPSRVNN